MANVTTKVDLVINRLSQQKYDQLSAAGLLNPNQLYVTSGGADAVLETRKVVGKALSADITAADISSAISLSGYSPLSALDGKQDIVVGTTEEWWQQLNFQPKKGQIVIWSDKDTIVSSDQSGNEISVDIPGFKVGDGNAYNVDLPFAGDELSIKIAEMLQQHASSDSHLSSGERSSWNHKITIGSLTDPTDDGVVGETLIITRN